MADWKELANKPDEWKSVKYDDPRLDAFAMEVEKRYELPQGMVVALKNAGERSNTGQVSGAGAQGVMQFTPSTRKLQGGAFDHDVNDPFASIDAAGKFMKQLLTENKGNPIAAIANYNGGPAAGKAVRAGKEPPAKETKEYVNRIKSYLDTKYASK
jgi:soluble lytic murein transglycosylase-like protein